jgi:hypothetical protein
VNTRTAVVGQEAAISARSTAKDSVSLFAVASFAYGFFIRRFWLIARLLLVPISAAGVILYVCLSSYISELLFFLGSPAPRVASVALGMLAAGIFLSLFCYSVAVSAVMNAVLGKPQKSAWALLRTARQDWRVYAAYLRLLLVLSVGLLASFAAAVYVAPLFGFAQTAISWALMALSAIGVYWLIARIGFLVPPVIAAGEGPVLRAAWAQSRKHPLGNCVLVALLGAPGCLLWFSGEFLFRFEAPPASAAAGSSLAHYATAMAQTLGTFIALASVSAFVSIALLTAGAIRLYAEEQRRV